MNYGIDWIQTRLADLIKLKDGWFNGQGKAITPLAIEKMQNLLEHSKYCQDKVIDSYLYPTTVGGILLEFTYVGCDISIEVLPDGSIDICGVETDEVTP